MSGHEEYENHIANLWSSVESNERVAAGYKDQINELKKQMSKAQDQADMARQDIIGLMIAEGDLGSIPVAGGGLKLHRNPAKVVFRDGFDIPKEYKREKIVVEPDKKKIAADLKDGVELEFAELETSYRIKVEIEA